jgi:SAM-dependent methyltransferase
MLTSQAEAAKYAKTWALPEYRVDSPGANHAEMFHALTKSRGISVLDVGAGAGAGSRALQTLGYKVHACDITDAGWDKSSNIPFFQASICEGKWPENHYDWTFCCDMMEHLPTQFTALAIRNMLATAAHGCYFSVCFHEDNLGRLVGEHLHLTVQPFKWWLQLFRDLGRVEVARDLIGDGIFLVTA